VNYDSHHREGLKRLVELYVGSVRSFGFLICNKFLLFALIAVRSELHNSHPKFELSKHFFHRKSFLSRLLLTADGLASAQAEVYCLLLDTMAA
jgi:hypothetical protein